jgi:hypothetical protein
MTVFGAYPGHPAYEYPCNPLGEAARQCAFKVRQYYTGLDGQAIEEQLRFMGSHEWKGDQAILRQLIADTYATIARLAPKDETTP